MWRATQSSRACNRDRARQRVAQAVWDAGQVTAHRPSAFAELGLLILEWVSRRLAACWAAKLRFGIGQEISNSRQAARQVRIIMALCKQFRAPSNAGRDAKVWLAWPLLRADDIESIGRHSDPRYLGLTMAQHAALVMMAAGAWFLRSERNSGSGLTNPEGSAGLL
jgi:hypothetical protein